MGGQGRPRSQHKSGCRSPAAAELLQPWAADEDNVLPGSQLLCFGATSRLKDMDQVAALQDDEISPEFQQQGKKMCSYTREKSAPKTVPGGHNVTGRAKGDLAATYVEGNRSGAVPRLESAVLALARIKNTAAVKDAVTLYRDLMEQRAKLPTETVGELLKLHTQCEREALELFMARAFKDDICEFQADLIRQVGAVQEKFFRDNEQASWDKCKAALRDLSQDMEKRICEGVYIIPGGYDLFRGDKQAVVEKYQELPGKGVKADAVLLEFLQSHEVLAECILKTDRSLTEKERELKSKQEQHERAEQEREVQRRKEAEEREKLQDQLRSCKEQELRLRQKLEDFLERQQEEQKNHKSEEEKSFFNERSENRSFWEKAMPWIKRFFNFAILLLQFVVVLL